MTSDAVTAGGEQPASGERRALAKGLIFVGAATMVGNAAAYLLSMVAARVLTPAEFGALGALLGLLVIVSVLGIAVQAVAARRIATASGDLAAVEGQLMRMSVVVGAAIIVAAIVLAWPIGAIFAIPTLAVGTGMASLGFVVVGSAALGIAQGRELHVRFSWAFIANTFGRAVFGILGVLLLDTVTGVGLGILVGCAVGAFVAYRMVVTTSGLTKIEAGLWPEFGHVAHALIVLFTLTNIDVLLARLFLPEEASGEYSVGVLLAKIAFFLPNAIIIVLFPKMTAGNSKRAVYIATGLTAILGLTITVVSALLGPLVIRILGGAQYSDLGSEAWLFALEGSAFALVQVLLYARLAAQDTRAVIAVWAGLVILVLTVSLWRHGSVSEIVTTVVAVSLLLTVVGLIMDRRQSPPIPIPVEQAE